MIKRTFAAVLVGLMVLVISTGAALAAEKKFELKMVGLECIKDEIMIGSIFDNIIGIKDYELDRPNGRAMVTIEDEDTSVEAINKKLDKKGFGINEATEIAE
jgi:hypothetical protein